MAQLVAHLHGMQGVRGSSPLSSTEWPVARAEKPGSLKEGPGFLLSGWWSWGSSEGLVVAGGVDGELSQELTGGGVDNA